MPHYHRYTIQGHHSPDAAIGLLGAAAAEGYVVRVDAAANETHVIIATDQPASSTRPFAAGVRAGGTVSEADVLGIP
jgi:hypothetical protein